MSSRTKKSSSASVDPGKAIMPILSTLNIDPQNDTFVIKGGAGVGVAHVKKPDGRVMSVHVHANGALQQYTAFDPTTLTVDQRRSLEGDLYRKGMTQSDIADLVGKSQPTVANDLKILRERGEIE